MQAQKSDGNSLKLQEHELGIWLLPVVPSTALPVRPGWLGAARTAAGTVGTVAVDFIRVQKENCIKPLVKEWCLRWQMHTSW